MVLRGRFPAQGGGLLSTPSATVQHEVRCTTCHRLEAWVDGQRHDVITPGGQRAVVGSPQRAAWTLLTRDDRVVVARCEGCGQPLTADADSGLPRTDWALALGDRTLHVAADGSVRGPEGPLDRAEAHALVWQATEAPPWWREIRVGRSVFQAGVLMGLAGPFTAFAMAVLALSIFMGPAAEKWAQLGAAVMDALR